ncbi:MAG: transketolase family protein [Leptospiraceae bacterium]|nr:transketolase family protein [Leptospiraceae bacterium]MCB1315301.1 transketolase family protein [Leptospiraceae bacterium]
MEKKATRDAYGDTLLALGAERPEIVVLDADLSGSTKTNKFAKQFPERFFNVGVAEQNLVGMSAGFAQAGQLPFASSFAMFLSGRAWEIVRNTVAYPGLNVKLVATHAGVTVGEDGASHQMLEDIALMRVIPDMTVIVPSDYPETEQVIRAVADLKGPCYVRLGRSSVPVLAHKKNYQFKPGKAEVRRDGGDVTIIACGIMVAAADEAAEILARQGIDAAVLNMASIKPIDSAAILKYARKTGLIITAEEHNVVGGLGSAVAEVVTGKEPVLIQRVGMQDRFGQSGDADELIRHYRLTAAEIVRTVRKHFKADKKTATRSSVSPNAKKSASKAQRSSTMKKKAARTARKR